MVSLTNTAVSFMGSRMVVPGTGILLQNGMLWFDPEPGRANSVAAGKRPVVNMVPALGFRHGEPPSRWARRAGARSSRPSRR